MKKINLKKFITFIFVILIVIIGVFLLIKYQKNQSSKQIPIDVSYKRFQGYEKELRNFAKTNDFKFSSHGDCYDESCYKTIILDSSKEFNISIDFRNFEGSEELELSFDSNIENTSIFLLLDYDLLEQIFVVLFDKSYKNELLKKSDELLNLKNGTSSKVLRLDKKYNITAQYFLRFDYESKGVKSNNYYSSLIISKN